jgi:hypothetical protein
LPLRWGPSGLTVASETLQELPEELPYKWHCLNDVGEAQSQMQHQKSLQELQEEFP